jgi:cellulose synthase/poly-beta-1,6-N-acetylglucosamine synthase-like glycosyltransferase
LLFDMQETPPAPAPPGGLRVAVVTTFVPSGEPRTMLEKTLVALVSLEYPHDTWVLDEGDDAEVKNLCARLGVLHFSRKHLPQFQTPSGTFEAGSKHGNYNAWLHTIGFRRYDIVSMFDPDHVPSAGFLSVALGYFADPKVGYVQFPQAYYNGKSSFIARGAAEESRGFYSIVQRANQALGSPTVIGCHNTHRIAALRQVGGLASHAADDLLITLSYHSRGWQVVYVPRIMAQGLAPVDWCGYLAQQRRWARSLFDIKLRVLPRISAGWPFRQRLFSFVQGLTYLQDGIVGSAAAILLPLMAITGFGQGAVSRLASLDVAAALGVLLVTDLYPHRFFLDAADGRGFHWRAAIVRFAKWPYTLLALCEVMRNRKFPYTLTRKAGAGGGVLFWPHIAIALLTAAAWFAGAELGRIRFLSVHLLFGAVILTCLALVLSGALSFPPPYDSALQDRDLALSADYAAERCPTTD